jgi:Lrp/AsnC family transcriptional regulator, leucine-responsive regulatory protein
MQLEPMDEFDRRIISALQRNARLTNLELEQEVKLSHSAISRRIKRLEASGIIEGYVARINNEKIGFKVHAFVSVTRSPATSALDLAQQLAAIDGVSLSYIVTGDQDVFLEVVAKDLQDFSDLMLTKVQAVSGVATTKTIFAIRTLGKFEPLDER